MRDKRIKLIYFSLRGSEGKEFILSGKRILMLILAVFMVSLVLAGSSIALFTDLYHNFRIQTLTQTNASLRTQLYKMGQVVDKLEIRMARLEKENDDLGIFADQPQIDSDTRQVGVGGAVQFDDQALDILPHDLKYETGEIQTMIDKVSRKMELYSAERDHHLTAIEDRQIKWDHRPSIRPVERGRISDAFGYRHDPFQSIRRHHDGLDIAIRQGTPVKATADGKVILAKNKYRVNQGYGKEIIIDHSDGIRTRYAHLHDVNVKVGDTVKRHDNIGTVGSTGRSTGPHLHYEVIRYGEPIDPEKYILND